MTKNERRNKENSRFLSRNKPRLFIIVPKGQKVPRRPGARTGPGLKQKRDEMELGRRPDGTEL